MAGVVELECEVMELPSDPDLTLVAYAVEPGTLAGDALALLANWAHDQERRRLPPALRPVAR